MSVGGRLYNRAMTTLYEFVMLGGPPVYNRIRVMILNERNATITWISDETQAIFCSVGAVINAKRSVISDETVDFDISLWADTINDYIVNLIGDLMCEPGMARYSKMEHLDNA